MVFDFYFDGVTVKTGNKPEVTKKERDLQVMKMSGTLESNKRGNKNNIGDARAKGITLTENNDLMQQKKHFEEEGRNTGKTIEQRSKHDKVNSIKDWRDENGKAVNDLEHKNVSKYFKGKPSTGFESADKFVNKSNTRKGLEYDGDLNFGQKQVESIDVQTPRREQRGNKGT